MSKNVWLRFWKVSFEFLKFFFDDQWILGIMYTGKSKAEGFFKVLELFVCCTAHLRTCRGTESVAGAN